MDQASHQHPIAYFCAEYGLESRLPIYAGGLGVLAGDTLKAAADANLPMVGIGLLYHGQAAHQHITAEGLQQEQDHFFDPVDAGLEHVYVDDQPLFVHVHLTELDIWLQCWQKKIGPGVTLYLLDTHNDQNASSQRDIMCALYSGTQEEVVKQQLLLGIGGVKLLKSLGIKPCFFHVNEGRPAFLHWQLVRQYMDEHGVDHYQARQHAIKHTVYTNHTLVGAGNQSYPRWLIGKYAAYYADKMGISLDELLADGIGQDPDRFEVTTFALNTSARASGVSRIHTSLSEQTWPRYDWVNVTNGVHLPSWQDRQLPQLVDDRAGLWRRRLDNKHQLNQFVIERTGYGFDPNRLVIGWARRIAGYKHLEWLFADVERLRALLANDQRPVQLLVAGKAHFLDDGGKRLLQEVIGYMQRQLSGWALFIPDYDLDVARRLVQGSDVWLNTPEPGMEASGTSGMKAMANGALSLSVADGWVPEVDWSDKGWIIDPAQPSQSIYTLLERDIVPLYYQRDQQGLPLEWLERMGRSIRQAEQFSAARMVREYVDRLYPQECFHHPSDG